MFSPSNIDAVVQAFRDKAASTPDDFSLFYIQPGVHIHPDPKMNSIPGYLLLLEQTLDQKPVRLLAWTPAYMLDKDRRKPGSSSSSSSPSSSFNQPERHLPDYYHETDLYTINVLVEQVKSVQIKYAIQLLGANRAIISLKSGIAFPPFYFHGGGTKEFLRHIQIHSNLIRSSTDRNLYIAADTDPLRRSMLLDELPLPESVAPASPASVPAAAHASPSPHPAPSPNPGVTPGEAKEKVKTGLAYEKQRLHDNMSDAGTLAWGILEGFSQVSRLTRHWAQQATSQSYQASPVAAPASPAKIDTDLGAFEVLNDFPGTASPAPTPAPPSPAPSPAASLSASSSSGILPGPARGPPLAADTWASFHDENGAVSKDLEPAVREAVFYQGVAQEIRADVWKYLLGVYQFGQTAQQRDDARQAWVQEYAIYKQQWTSITARQERHFAKFRARKHLIEKDVVRTDRQAPYYAETGTPQMTRLYDILVTYTFYNSDIGYVQGMNDLLSPILFVMENEEDAFVCFQQLMEKMQVNFNKDQVGMNQQLTALKNLLQILDPAFYDYLHRNDCTNVLFAYRWLLIIFKREFDFAEIPSLWEAIWSGVGGPNFHLFVALAILHDNRGQIMEEQMTFDQILGHLQGLSHSLNLARLLLRAKTLYDKFMAQPSDVRRTFQM